MTPAMQCNAMNNDYVAQCYCFSIVTNVAGNHVHSYDIEELFTAFEEEMLIYAIA